MDKTNLPELPEPESEVLIAGLHDARRAPALEDYYTAEQMHEYAARAVREAVPDAARYAELKRRYAAADFHYGEPPGCVLVFDVPQDVRVSANLDDTIDRLIAPTQDQENGS